MSVIEALLTGMAANGLYGLTPDAADGVIAHLKASEPGRIAALEATAVLHDDQRLREEIMGAMRLVAMSGTVDVDDAAIDAVRSATFDHRAGRIAIDGLSFDAPTLVTQGPGSAQATTVVAGEDKYRSLESDIDLERGVGTRESGEQSNL